MKRIAVIGCCGAGKSTFSRSLQAVSGLPLIHLDRIFWSANWTLPEMETFKQKVAKIQAAPEWIIDGNYFSTMRERVERADAVVFLDQPTAVCLWRVLRRIISGYGWTRPDVAEGCPEKFDIPFLTYVVLFRRRNRPKIVQLLAEFPPERIHIAKNDDDAERILHLLKPLTGIEEAPLDV